MYNTCNKNKTIFTYYKFNNFGGGKNNFKNN